MTDAGVAVLLMRRQWRARGGCERQGRRQRQACRIETLGASGTPAAAIGATMRRAGVKVTVPPLPFRPCRRLRRRG